MRAEMTVGLDLKSLENLRIVNGYGDIKKERKLSFEAPSSPEDSTGKYESDGGQADVSSSSMATKPKPKCGRPANPIPRHKRDSHIKAEYKRRDKIQKGFDTLMTMVPELCESTGKESRSSMLFKTAEYCRRLKSECGGAQTEIAALRQELEALGTEIHDLQELLPQHGTRQVEEKEVSMDSLYNQYITEETKSNWKFWVFGFFMRPLYDSYKESVSGTQKPEQFNHSVMDWIQNAMSLKTLRKGFLDSLRYISIHTGIMTKPENLQHEAQSRITDHYLTLQYDNMSLKSEVFVPSVPVQPAPPPPAASSRVTTPVGTPRVVTPAPGSHASVPSTPKEFTPIQTPSASPPRTPVVSRRSSNRDSVRSLESRSRSNSPETTSVKNKRRSSYRSRSGKRSPSGSVSDYTDSESKMAYIPSPQSTPSPYGSYMLGQGQHCTLPHQPNQQSVPMVTEPTPSKSTQVTQVTNSLTSLDNKVITSFVESLMNAMKPHETMETFNPSISQSNNISNAQNIGSVSNYQGNLYHSNIHSMRSFMKPNSANFKCESMSMEQPNVTSSSTCGRVNGYVPMEKSVVMTEAMGINLDNTASSTSSFHDSLISGMLPMDSDSMSGMPAFDQSLCIRTTQAETTSYQNVNGSTELCDTTSVTGLVDGVCKPDSQLMNTDDDSLMTFLKVDVMDMGTMMEFLKPDEGNL